ncbi:BT4734/BF3469 family protein [Allomuricauda sp. F6463D]|uniref:BT4734/BF3469 family protein n=1 Tax=Allomuricauda sp. F6463D TaxID=2926409 RepID=UPI001FF6F662|nr:BT4734/BF3469 family protein [Muricauda sp. F6463D]MCK0159593.1 hypothetical protein [Muricauda sp. F6463D]
MKVSRFSSIYNTDNPIQTDLQGELMDIKNGKYKNLINNCRYYTSIGDYDSYKSLKVKLPIVTFCGTFENGRKLENLVSYNGLMILDIDDLEIKEVENLKGLICKDKFVYALWRSPSGMGLKALIKVSDDPNFHKSSFRSLQDYFQKKYKIELDKSGSDITRLCFVSWDKDLYLNESSEVYLDKIIETESSIEKLPKEKVHTSLTKSAFATEGLNKPEHRKMIQLVIKYIKRKDISITETFDKWFRVALGISNTFSYDLGEKYFLQICELDKEKHSEIESVNILKYCYNNRKIQLPGSVSLGTIVFYAKEKGFVTKKNKHT